MGGNFREEWEKGLGWGGREGKGQRRGSDLRRERGGGLRHRAGVDAAQQLRRQRHVRRQDLKLRLAGGTSEIRRGMRRERAGARSPTQAARGPRAATPTRQGAPARTSRLLLSPLLRVHAETPPSLPPCLPACLALQLRARAPTLAHPQGPATAGASDVPSSSASRGACESRERRRRQARSNSREGERKGRGRG